MFLQKIPKSIISFCNYFLKLNFVSLAQNTSTNAPGFGGSCSSSLFCLTEYYSPTFLEWRENRICKLKSKEIQMPAPFKFFIVEEVMSSSLIAFEFEFTGEGESPFIPSHSKVLKSFKFHTSFNHSRKQTNKLIIILTFQNL